MHGRREKMLYIERERGEALVWKEASVLFCLCVESIWEKEGSEAEEEEITQRNLKAMPAVIYVSAFNSAALREKEEKEGGGSKREERGRRLLREEKASYSARLVQCSSAQRKSICSLPLCLFAPSLNQIEEEEMREKPCLEKLIMASSVVVEQAFMSSVSVCDLFRSAWEREGESVPWAWKYHLWMVSVSVVLMLPERREGEWNSHVYGWKAGKRRSLLLHIYREREGRGRREGWGRRGKRLFSACILGENIEAHVSTTVLTCASLILSSATQRGKQTFSSERNR